MTPEEKVELIKSLAQGLDKLTTIEVKVGDVFVLHLEGRAEVDLLERLYKQWQSVWVGTPDPPRLMVIDGNAKLTLLRRDTPGVEGVIE